MAITDYLFGAYRKKNNRNRITAHDVVELQRAGFFNAPVFKGEVDLILRDATTGKVQEHIHDSNLVTNALDDIFKSNYCGLLDYSKIMPIIPNLLGGVLCFQNGLGNDATSYGAPCDNHVTAHAGNEAPASVLADLTRGAPNDSESYRTEHGFRQCWEWTASQGIGQISSVALTHKNTGNYWIYNTNGDFQPCVRADDGTNNYYDSQASGGNYTENSKKAPTLFNPSTDLVYSFEQAFASNVSTLTVNKWKMPMLQNITLMSDALQGERSVQKTEATIELGTVTTYSNYRKPRNLCFVRPDWSHDLIYLYFITQTRTDGSNYGARLEYGTLNTDTLAYTYGGVIGGSSAGGAESNYNIYYLADAEAIRPIDYDDNGNLFFVLGKYARANVPRTGTASFYERQNDFTSPVSTDLCSVQGDFTVHGQTMTWGTGSTDEINIAPLNVTIGEGRRTVGGLPVSPIGFMSSGFANRNTKDSRIGCYLNTMYLGTKFNLSEPVEKLGNQSMQVIYTLTEVTS